MKVILALALFGSASASLFSSSSVENQKYMWESFKSEYGKVYATSEEEDSRFQIFLNNLKLIDERNAVDTAQHGITKFADQSPEEFKRTHLNYVPNLNSNRTFVDIEPLPVGASAVKDWTGIYTTPVKNQGYCGSCWAFSATEQIESDYWRVYGKEQILSAQQVTSCTDGGADGCNGGWTENAFDYAEGGLELDSDYPYTSGSFGVTGSCKTSSSLFVVKSTGYTTVSGGKFAGKENEAGMATYVGATGPLSVCVAAETWSSYTGGVMSVCPTSVDHCVQAVGIDTTASTPYWKVRNSWGTSWGESGFIRLKYGADTCAIASDANYASTATY